MSAEKERQSNLIVLPFGFKMGRLTIEKSCHHCGSYMDNLRLFYSDPEAVRMPFVNLLNSKLRVPIGGVREERYFCASCCENIAIKAF